MEKKIKIVIADDSTEFGQNCAGALKSYGMEVVLCQKDGARLINTIKTTHPDVVIADVFMPNTDILGVLAAMGKFKTPIVFPDRLEFVDSEQMVVYDERLDTDENL